MEHRQYKVIYRRYASLYFIIGLDMVNDINELGMLEFIHNMVETLDKYFENVCELDVSGLSIRSFTVFQANEIEKCLTLTSMLF